MKKFVATSAFVCLSLFALGAQAGQFHDLREKLLAVRTSMIDLLMHKETRVPAQWKAADEKSAEARKALVTLTAPPERTGPFNDLKAVATAFLDTRDKELREALVAGNDAEAKRLLTVVQKERFTKLTELSEVLDK